MDLTRFWISLTVSTQLAIFAFLGTLVTVIFALINKLLDRLIGRDGKKADDSSKLRGELMERLKHLEGRLDQMTTTNLILSRENAETKVRVELYDEERKLVRSQLANTKDALDQAVSELTRLKTEMDLQHLLHLDEKNSWMSRIRDLESQVKQLEQEGKRQNERTTS